MTQLLLAAAFFLGLHFGVAGTGLRLRLVGALGGRAYHAGFGVLSLLGLGWLFHAYRAAPYVETWGQWAAFKPVAAGLMLPAFWLAVAALASRAAILPAGGEPAAGVQRITRHPLLCGVFLWALAHLLANGDVAALLLFGSLLVLAVVGGRSAAAKRREKLGPDWDRYAAATSVIPFLAILQGRNRLAWRELPWWQAVLALLLWAAVMHFHMRWFGVAPWP